MLPVIRKCKKVDLKVLKTNSSVPVAVDSPAITSSPTLWAFRFIGFRNKERCISGIMQPQIEAETDVSKRD